MENFFTKNNNMSKKTFQLTETEYNYLKRFIKTGKKSGKELERSYILLAFNKGKSQSEIMDYYHVGRTTIWRVMNNYIENGLEYALRDKERPGQPKKYNEKHESEVIALVCSDSPKGRKRWTLRLLSEHLRKLKGMDTISYETVRLILKKTNVNLG